MATKASKKENIAFNQNDDAMRLAISRMEFELDKINLGGGNSKAKAKCLPASASLT